MLRPKAQAIIDRLKAVDQTKPCVFDKNKISMAFYEHFKAFGLNFNKKIEFYEDLSAAKDAAKDAARGAAWDAARDAAMVSSWDAATGTAFGLARSAARGAAWDAAMSVARGVARGAALAAAWDAAWSAAIENSLLDHPMYSYFRTIWLPFVDAFEVGLFFYWVTKDKIIACKRPTFSFKENILHNENGPAIKYTTEEHYFLNNVRVEKSHVLTPAESINPEEILKCENAEQRRELLRKVGVERFIQKCGAKNIDEIGDYSLLEISIPGYRPMRYLKMRNPSIRVWHVEGVPNDCENVQQCLNWRSYGDKTKSWLPIELT